MINVYLDCETTGLNPYCSEVIEAFFYIDESNSFHLKCKPLEWSDEAAIIHKIPYSVAMSYPEKKDAFRGLLNWLPKDFRFLSWVNKNTMLGHINFDLAIIVNELNLLGCKNYYLENEYNMKPAISVLDLAKKAAFNRLFTPIFGKDAYRLGITDRIESKTSNRQSFSQGSVYYALFGELPPNAHDAKDDVLNLVKIRTELLRLSNETTNYFI
jgi:hypothetical protein